MIASSILALLAGGTGVVATAIQPLVPAREWCGTSHPTSDQLSRTARLAVQEQASRFAYTNTTHKVETYVHIITTSEAEEDGWLSDATINAQMEVLNRDYKPHGFSFTLAGITREANTSIALNQDEVELKSSRRQGSYAALNLYMLTSLGGGLLGYATFPGVFVQSSEDFQLDGVVLLAATAPGGAISHYNEGRTATHEVGHWLNLYHTFQGGCLGNGDYVADTPAMSTPTSGCPEGTNKDSCPNVEGLDPIHNYMDYSYDNCYNEFTPGQAARILSSWAEYRAYT